MPPRIADSTPTSPNPEAHSLSPLSAQFREQRKRQLNENDGEDDDNIDESSSLPAQRKSPQPRKRTRRKTTVKESIHVVGNLPPEATIDGSVAFIRLSDSTSDEICRTETHLSGGTPDLIKRLEVAAKATELLVSHGWQTRQDIYSKTTVLLLSWADDDLRVKTEIRQLKSLFSDAFCYDVCEWELPSGSGVYLKTVNKVGEFAAEYGGEGTLLIIYYGGHGYQDLARQSSGPIWISRRRRDGDTEKPTELESNGLFPILAEQDGDVLLIFDCCQAVPSIIRPKGKGVISALSATGFESGPLGIAPEPGVHSFTHSLVDELAATANMFRISPNPQPISDIELHVKLVTRLRQSAPSVRREADGTLRRDRDNLVCFEQQNRRTPHYQFLSAGKDPRPIYLKPNIALQKPSSAGHSPDSAIDPGPGEHVGTAPSPLPAIGTSPVPMVLVRVMLSGDEFDVQSWASWILKCPSTAAGVRVEGQWGSFSTLQIIRLPLDLWNLLPRHPALSFIGFVTTENQADRLNKTVSARVLELQPGKQPTAVYSKKMADIPRPKNVGAGPAIATFTDTELRFVLSEIIKTSSIDTGLLVDLIRRQELKPDWMAIQLPRGRNMRECLIAAESVLGDSSKVPFTSGSNKNDIVTTRLSPPQVKKEEVFAGLQVKTARMNDPSTSLQPRPGVLAPFPSYLSPSPQPSQVTATARRPAPRPPPAPPPRKRGRPSKSEALKQLVSSPDPSPHPAAATSYSYQAIAPLPPAPPSAKVVSREGDKWDEVGAIFLDLYVTQKLPSNEVLKRMEELGLRANPSWNEFMKRLEEGHEFKATEEIDSPQRPGTSNA